MNENPQKGEYLEILLRSHKTVFSTKDAALLWNESSNEVISDRLKKYVNAGKTSLHLYLYFISHN